MSDLWPRHLQLIQKRDAELADRLAATEPATLTLSDAADEQAPGGTLRWTDDSGASRTITLASRRRPISEAKKLAAQADLQKHAVVVMIGVGLGHHLRELADRTAGRGILVVYEPDLALLRAVMEQIDCMPWLRQDHVVLIGGKHAASELGPLLSRHLEGAVGYIAQGVQILTHPAAGQMHRRMLETFTRTLTDFVSYCRTNVATTLAQSAVTCRNLVNNIGRYAAGETVNVFRNAAAGKPAVLIAAGPSLAKNVHLLTDPDVRQRVIVIAVQTVLKPLLARGVRPDFVTALDYHDISRRFYEGLPPLADVTLIAEPKANKAILDDYPGPVAVCHSRFLDTLLGPARRPIDGLPAGTTVAHLSFYFAQYLGCDPIIMTGQDLGFTDGLYYCPGTAIHEVWAPELSVFNTLEMMEWKRVARHRPSLKKLDDIHGRPIYTDQQMLTYLRQFERDFAAATQTIIDATEGGLPKARAQTMTLAEALGRHATEPIDDLPTPRATLDRDRLAETLEHVRSRREQIATLRQLTVRTQPVLRQMKAHQRDPRRMDKLFAELEELKGEVTERNEAFALVNELNQIGAFHRLKSDRQIQVREDADPYERQAAQLDRDLTNLDWLVDGCNEALDMFDDAQARLVEQLEATEPAMQEATP